MAKIYETKDDFQREMLEKQAADLRHKGLRQSYSGASLLIWSFLIDMFNRGRGKINTVMSVASSVLFVGSVVEAFKAWKTGSRAHDLELQRERMGPQAVVLPQGMVQEESAEQECTPCKSKKMREALEGKSLREYATRPVDPGAHLVH